MTQKLQLKHYPQIPCRPFCIEVDSPEEASKIAKILAAYDQFQYQQRIKPDFCNSTDLTEWDEEEKEFLSWYGEDGEDFRNWEAENSNQKYWKMLLELNSIKF